MSTAYGGWAGGDDYRSVLTVTKTDNGSSVTITVTGKVQSLYGYFSGMTLTGSATCNGSSVASGSISSMSNNRTYTLFSNRTVTVNKTTKAQSVAIKLKLSGSGAYAGGSTATVTVSVPALSSVTVSYNGNKPSGASGTVSNVPASQTKYSGTALKLTTQKPTLSGYTFQSWNTASNGSGTRYSPGATYSTDSALSLYAQWKQNYADPTITKMSIYRCSNASGTQADDGAYAYLVLGWKVNQSGKTPATSSPVTIRYKEAGTSSWNRCYVKSGFSMSGTSGESKTALYSNSAGTTLLSFDTSKAYLVEVTFKDSGSHSATTNRTLSAAYFTFDIMKGGRGVGGMGIGHSADVPGALRIGMDVQLDGWQETSGGTMRERGNFSCVDNREHMPASSSAANDSNAAWGNGLFFYGSGFDPNSSTNPIYQAHGYVRGVNVSGGARGVQIEAQRYNTAGTTRYTNALNILIDSSGNHVVQLDEGAWLDALGGYKAKTALTLGSACESYGTTQAPYYEKRAGLVIVSGAVKPKSTVASGGSMTIATLPSGFRPVQQFVQLCQGTSNATWLLEVGTDGVMTASRYRNGTTNAQMTTSTWLPFHVVFTVN